MENASTAYRTNRLFIYTSSGGLKFISLILAERMNFNCASLTDCEEKMDTQMGGKKEWDGKRKKLLPHCCC